MTTPIILDVIGLPVGQGSKKAWVNRHTGRAQMREQAGQKITLWRQDVKAVVADWIDGYRDTACDHDYAPCPFCVWTPLGAPLLVSLEFRFPRPRSHYRTGSNAHLLRDNAPGWPVSRATPDVDKAVRSTLDALCIAGLFADDSQVAELRASKTYADDAARPGAHIGIWALETPCT